MEREKDVELVAKVLAFRAAEDYKILNAITYANTVYPYFIKEAKRIMDHVT
jgi:hypothetical protein